MVEEQVQAVASQNILVLDPDEGVAATLADILEGGGYRVAVGHTLQDAVTLLLSSDFDLILTEAFGQTYLFRFDPTFLRELRSVTGGIPIILCSSFFSADRLRAGDFSLAEVNRQPFRIDGLLEKVSLVLGTT